MAEPFKYLRRVFNNAVIGGFIVASAWLGCSDKSKTGDPELAKPAGVAQVEPGDLLGGPPGIRAGDAPLVINEYKSKNYEQRFIPVKYIVLHYTATETCDIALNTLTNNKGEGRVSSHYLVDEKGGVLSLVDEDFSAWHAGKSYWDGDPRINDYSIGIEIQNRSKEPFSYPQMQAVIKLCTDIMQRHSIPPENVLAHSDVAPDRKSDPGEYFPWQALARYNIGIWPDSIQSPPPGTDHMKLLRELGYMRELGFDKKVPTKQHLIKAFQLHYVPRTFLDSSKVGVMDQITSEMLYSVVLKKREMKDILTIQNKEFVANLQLKPKLPIL